MSAFRARDVAGGVEVLEAWCALPQTHAAEAALAWTLRGFVGCLFSDQESAVAAFERAAELERAAGQQVGADHTGRLAAMASAAQGDLKALRKGLTDALEEATRTTQTTQEALHRRALGVVALLFGKASQAQAMWVKAQQQLHFLDREAESEALRRWLMTLREMSR